MIIINITDDKSLDFDLVQLGNSVKKSISIRNVTQIHANWKISIQNSENPFVYIYFYYFKTCN